MDDQRLKHHEREIRVSEWRRAWFEGWAEGASWALARTAHALRRSGHPEPVMRSVVEHVVPGARARRRRPSSSREGRDAQ